MILDVSVPIYQMEQKIERLEQDVQRLTFDISDAAIKLICERINSNPVEHLPNFSKKLSEI